MGAELLRITLSTSGTAPATHAPALLRGLTPPDGWGARWLGYVGDNAWYDESGLAHVATVSAPQLLLSLRDQTMATHTILLRGPWSVSRRWSAWPRWLDEPLPTRLDLDGGNGAAAAMAAAMDPYAFPTAGAPWPDNLNVPAGERGPSVTVNGADAGLAEGELDGVCGGGSPTLSLALDADGTVRAGEVVLYRLPPAREVVSAAVRGIGARAGGNAWLKAYLPPAASGAPAQFVSTAVAWWWQGQVHLDCAGAGLEEGSWTPSGGQVTDHAEAAEQAALDRYGSAPADGSYPSPWRDPVHVNQEFGYDTRGDWTVTAGLMAPRPVVAGDGSLLVCAGQRRWRRRSAGEPWSEAGSVVLAAPLLLSAARPTGEWVCLDTALLAGTAGGAWRPGPPATVLSPAVAGWPRGPAGVRDVATGDDGQWLSVAMEHGQPRVYRTGGPPVTLTESWPAPVGGPVVTRDAAGRWRMGAMVAGEWREYVSADGAVWQSARRQVLGPGATMRTARWWTGSSGAQVLAGAHAQTGAVCCLWRPGVGSAWRGPVVVASTGVGSGPYVLQRADGSWEIGCLLADGWRLWRSGAPGGPYREVPTAAGEGSGG